MSEYHTLGPGPQAHQTMAARQVYDQDLELLQTFHGRVYDGDTVSDEDTQAAHAAWHRIAESPLTAGNVLVFALLAFTVKYLPSTPVA